MSGPTTLIVQEPAPIIVTISNAQIPGPIGATGPQGPPGNDGTGVSVIETPTGVIDGVNTVFELTDAPVTDSLFLTLNGLIQFDSVSGDFVLSGDTITFNPGSIPQTGDVLVAYYKVD